MRQIKADENPRSGTLWGDEEDTELAKRFARFMAESVFIHQRNRGGIRARLKKFLSLGHEELTDGKIRSIDLKEKNGNKGVGVRTVTFDNRFQF